MAIWLGVDVGDHGRGCLSAVVVPLWLDGKTVGRVGDIGLSHHLGCLFRHSGAVQRTLIGTGPVDRSPDDTRFVGKSRL
jgi:hypothetical protein